MAGWREEWIERRDRKLDTPMWIRVCGPGGRVDKERLADIEEWQNPGGGGDICVSGFYS